MKIIKRIFVVILTIIGLFLLVALLTKKDYAVERQITINQPKDLVFDYVKYLKNQDNFSVWAQIDPDMRKSYVGVDGTVGFVSAWDSDMRDAGKGEQEITGIVEGERIDYELRFKEPFESTDQAYLITEAVGESQTLVTWGFKGSFPFPMNAFLLVMNMEKMLGSDFEQNLANLKEILE